MSDIKTKFNEIASRYNMSYDTMVSAFVQAGMGMRNMPQIQNKRIKAISSLPVEFSKDEIGDFLRKPFTHERELRQTSEVLKWSAYPYYKAIKTYQDINTYRHYIKPLYIDNEQAQSKEFMREAKLLDKLSKVINPEKQAHKITGEALTNGKVFYTMRTDVDKSHNKVNYAFMQRLPQDWCTIIGFNNISGYTISFNMMYFMQPGADYKQFGDLFDPYINDFSDMFVTEKKPYYVYASKNTFDHTRLKKGAYGNPRVFQQSGTWFYYVTLPIDRVWTFEIDDTTSAVAPSLSGLMLTYAQQADYEAAQLSLILNPLIKIFTGEIPYYNDSGRREQDDYRLSEEGRAYYEAMFDMLMGRHNTGGTAFYSAPVQNIKSHDFAQSANANEISESFNRYGLEKAGLISLIAATEDVKASQVSASMKLESRYTNCIYKQFEAMMTETYRRLNLNYDWEFKMFGNIFNEETIRAEMIKMYELGDTSALFVLSALTGDSWVDKISQLTVINASGIMDIFRVPETAYTQSGKVGREEVTIEDITSDSSEEGLDNKEV